MTVPHVKGLNCPQCGAAQTIRGFGHALTVVCPQCLSVLDAKDPNLQVLQRFEHAQRIAPLIPLGKRGKWRGRACEVIGFQVRTIQVESEKYSWSEYLLFHPYQGFRYLTEYRGHWNFVRTLHALPERITGGTRPAVRFQGETFAHFQTAKAETTFVLGEFPWQARMGDTAVAMDFISPPRLLSSENTGAETIWSLGEYVDGGEVWQAFQLPGKAPRPRGVFANQPNPYKGRVHAAWNLLLLLMLALFGVWMAMSALARREEVFRDSYTLSPQRGSEPSFVTRIFELKGRPSNVEISIRTDLSNNWAYFALALINETTGDAYDFGREVSYYAGRDSDGAWSEGRVGDSFTIPRVPSGRYYLRVEPETAPESRGMSYDLRVRRDVPGAAPFVIAGILLLIPPLFTSIRAISFHRERWMESDYAS